MRCALAAAYQRLDARHQLAQVEGLAQVIVRAGVEQFDDRPGTFARRQNQYGRGILFRTQRTQHRLATLARQHQVQDYDVVAALPRQHFTFDAIGCVVDGKPPAVTQSSSEVLG